MTKFKHKQWGDIVTVEDGKVIDMPARFLTDAWEEYEEPKEDGFDNIITLVETYSSNDSERYPKEIVDKLKAWKRLKDKGFRFEVWTIDDGLRVSVCTNFDSDGIYDEYRKEVKKDLDTCFGDEE